MHYYNIIIFLKKHSQFNVPMCYVALKWLETAIHRYWPTDGAKVSDINLKSCNPFIFMTKGYTSFQSAAIWKDSHLYSAVAPVGYDDVPICVHGHSSGSVELAVAFAMGAKFEQELSVCIVNLGWTSTGLEEANMAPTYW